MIRVPYRKPITFFKTEQELSNHLDLFLGKNHERGYFVSFGVGPGWNDIILDLHEKLVEEAPEDYYIVQVKEKFGTLRYYVGPMTEAGFDYIQEAEMLSAVTCEQCGRPGTLRSDRGWLRTLCDWDNRVERFNTWTWINLRRPIPLLYWRVRFAYNRWLRSRNGSAKK